MDLAKHRKALKAIVDSGDQEQKRIKDKIARYRKEVEAAERSMQDAITAENQAAYQNAYAKRNFAVSNISAQERILAAGVISHERISTFVENVSKDRDESIIALFDSVDQCINNFYEAVDRLQDADNQYRELMKEAADIAKKRSGSGIAFGVHESNRVIAYEPYREIRGLMNIFKFWRDRFLKGI